MNISDINPNYVYIAGTAIIVLLASWIFSLELRLKNFFRGKKAKDLESVMLNINEELKRLNASKEEMEKYLTTVEGRLKKSVQNIRTVRFSPFGDTGSNQSFAIAFLDEDGNGVVLSGLHTRDKVSIFAKPVEKRSSQYALTQEEKEAIKATELNEK